LAFFPELVNPELADAGAAQPHQVEGGNRGWISITLALASGHDQHRPGRSPRRNLRQRPPTDDILVERLGDFWRS